MTEGDKSARDRALNERAATLLVEAAAGTGKTSLLAARVALLLADGVPPRAIAAITFTEFAAGELAARVREYADALLAGLIPVVLESVLPAGLSVTARDNLAGAVDRLDELATSTIHGFCRAILSDHAVSVGLDPGVEVLDAVAADAAFDAVFDGWLRKRLDGSRSSTDAIAVLAAHDPRGVVAMLRGIAGLQRKHRSARTPTVDLIGRPDLDFMDAVDAFRRWSAGVPKQKQTLDVIADLETLLAFFADAFERTPGIPELWRLAHPPRVPTMLRDKFVLRRPQWRQGWRDIAGREDGTRLADEADRLFSRAEACYGALLGRVSGILVAAVSRDVDELVDAWEAHKGAAALVDFDDLLEATRAILRDHEPVRSAVSARYRHILVDEFQDTDPVQAEVLFRIAAEAPVTGRWQDAPLRTGALFLVGDPKQAIYSFRGADIGAYEIVKAILLGRWPSSFLRLTSNQRSRPGVCAHADLCFAAPLDGKGQPGYSPLFPTRSHDGAGPPSVSSLVVQMPVAPKTDQVRDAEAEAVAALCAQLIGSLQIEDRDGMRRRLGPADIALLTPAGTGLWRYERALARRGIAVASQAGKSFYARQETQDLICLARVLSDAADTLAFGALMRGPLIGFTDERLLDVVEALRERLCDSARLSMHTDPGDVADSEVRQVLATLRALRRTAGTTTPFQCLSAAIATLNVRTIVTARSREEAAGAIANIDAFLAMAGNYAVRGLRRFVQDLDAGWRARRTHAEGRAESEGACIEIVTIHGSKGAEWPVVIPINTVSQLQPREKFFRRPSDDTLHWALGEVIPPELLAAVGELETARAHERQRVWYVAATRARDLLVLPRLPADAGVASWARVVDLRFDQLPEFDPAWLPPASSETAPVVVNGQDAVTFATEAAAIVASTPTHRWLRPSDHDPDRLSAVETVDTTGVFGLIGETPAGPGRIRGLLIHKLLEELINEETPDEADALVERASVLLDQLAPDDADRDTLPEATEVASVVRRTLALPEIAPMRDGLLAEVAIHATLEQGSAHRPIDGRADAIFIAPEGDRIVIDWKSDVSLTPQEQAFHVAQMSTYLEATGTRRGALVYVSAGLVRWVDAPPMTAGLRPGDNSSVAVVN